MSDWDSFITNDWSQFSEGLALLVGSYMIHVWATVFPWVTGITAFLSFCVLIHSIIRIGYKWYHGINSITDRND